MKIIEWAFLCASAELDDRGGLNITHLYDKFSLSDLPELCVVFHIVVPKIDILGGLQPYPFLGEFLLSITIKTEAQDDVEMYSTEFLVAEKIFAVPIGNALNQPGRYSVELRADGALQQTLDLFLQ